MAASLQKSLSRQSVLVVDDNAINREFLHAVLADQVAEIRMAPDGAAALEMVRDWRPDLVLMDLHMPGMDGLEAWRRMSGLFQTRSESRPLAVVLTADFRPAERKRLLDAGFDAFIGKPVSVDTLLGHLRALVELGPGTEIPISDAGLERSLSGDNLPLLDDRQALAATNSDDQLLARLRALLLKDLCTANQDLDDSLSRGQWATAKAIIHRVKGGCAYTGAARLHSLCAEMENELTDGQPGSAYLRFMRTLARTRAALERELSAQ